ncbi:uncharacterized protein UV8b_07201 [Ustilaginoidea virens]|uniref:Uncharacterized protein n=1 Tax=Ustilaginoidea virens TaxID=1159556 RepID=A0A8E5HWL5_USTVR|nr:uncharacterized protein UV8b_07201 [Ustilaginoidea virens]QUC22960.1 hypothetical protein UV8b_07201 [Ustilaginoidea virens]
MACYSRSCWFNSNHVTFDESIFYKDEEQLPIPAKQREDLNTFISDVKETPIVDDFELVASGNLIENPFTDEAANQGTTPIDTIKAINTIDDTPQPTAIDLKVMDYPEESIAQALLPSPLFSPEPDDQTEPMPPLDDIFCVRVDNIERKAYEVFMAAIMKPLAMMEAPYITNMPKEPAI